LYHHHNHITTHPQAVPLDTGAYNVNFRALLAFPEELKSRTKHTERMSNHFTPPIQTLGARCYDWPPDFALHFVFVPDAATPQFWYFQMRGAISFMKAKGIPI